MTVWCQARRAGCRWGRDGLQASGGLQVSGGKPYISRGWKIDQKTSKSLWELVAARAGGSWIILNVGLDLICISPTVFQRTLFQKMAAGAIPDLSQWLRGQTHLRSYMLCSQHILSWRCVRYSKAKTHLAVFKRDFNFFEAQTQASLGSWMSPISDNSVLNQFVHRKNVWVVGRLWNKTSVLDLTTLWAGTSAWQKALLRPKQRRECASRVL